ncbi:MAG: hypothetical protein MJZ37_04190 [Bacilli bacterium]|nr:hypothetical protein [Bacilli bacterium]
MKKRYLYLFLGLNLLIISSISMSIAWFAGATNLSIEGIDLVIDADADLKISTNDDFEHAKDSLTADDFGDIGLFEPITSMTSEHSEWISNAEVQSPKFIAQYAHTGVRVPSIYQAFSGFFSKKIYLFSTHHMVVTVDSETTRVASDTETNESIAVRKGTNKANSEYRAVADKKIAELGIIDEAEKTQMYDSVRSELIEKNIAQYRTGLNSIDKSLRISLLDRNTLNGNEFTIIDPKKDGTTVFGGRLNTSKNDNYYDFYRDNDTNELKEVVFGDIKYQNHEIAYLPEAQEDVSFNGTPSCFNAGTRKGVRPLDLEDLATNVQFYEEQSVALNEADVSKHPEDENTGYLIELQPGVPHPLNLSIYLEGWDRDNTDYTSEGVFSVSLHFKLYRQGDFR